MLKTIGKLKNIKNMINSKSNEENFNSTMEISLVPYLQAVNFLNIIHEELTENPEEITIYIDKRTRKTTVNRSKTKLSNIKYTDMDMQVIAHIIDIVNYPPKKDTPEFIFFNSMDKFKSIKYSYYNDMKGTLYSFK
ncbi:hypothetical protein FPHOBKDP_00034 [Listeria phage LPJP1]|nr:hypothetical protein FPHOBKDP_00034 [Listeria phage LPJP1]